MPGLALKNKQRRRIAGKVRKQLAGGPNHHARKPSEKEEEKTSSDSSFSVNKKEESGRSSSRRPWHPSIHVYPKKKRSYAPRTAATRRPPCTPAQVAAKKNHDQIKTCANHRGGALPAIMSMIGPVETHDYRN